MSTITELDERQHATAIKAAVSTALGEWDAFDYDEVSEPLPDIFALVQVERRFNPNRRACGRASTSGWRVTIRAVGTTVDEARWALMKATQALDETVLTVADRPTTLLQFESSTAPELDDRLYSASATWTYAL